MSCAMDLFSVQPNLMIDLFSEILLIDFFMYLCCTLIGHSGWMNDSLMTLKKKPFQCYNALFVPDPLSCIRILNSLKCFKEVTCLSWFKFCFASILASKFGQHLQSLKTYRYFFLAIYLHILSNPLVDTIWNHIPLIVSWSPKKIVPIQDFSIIDEYISYWWVSMHEIYQLLPSEPNW